MKRPVLIPLAMIALAALAQMSMAQKLSPPATAECKLSDGKMVKIDYSSPRAKGRRIFGSASDGALVPFGEVWRTGADEATRLVVDKDATVGGKAVPAGRYTVFTVPRADGWTLIINKKTGEWGIPYKYQADELVRVPMTVSKTSGPVENFTIAFDQAGGKCNLRMEWENTQASVEVAGK